VDRSPPAPARVHAVSSPAPFGELARQVVAEARRRGLAAPSFRSPPRRNGAVRTLRRFPDGHCLVSVDARGRPVKEVLADLVDGVIAANGLEGAMARRWRATLVAAVLRPDRHVA
jgi:hypothetical protein